MSSDPFSDTSRNVGPNVDSDSDLARNPGLDPGLDPGQLGLGDMDAAAFRRHGHQVVDRIADYLEGVGELPVLAAVAPGDITAQLPGSAPAAPEPMTAILADIDRVIIPGLTHWNHPAFHAYFAITGSGPGILGEALSAAFNVNGMLWRTSPAATELEEVTLDWLRQMLGLDDGLRGIIMDTASIATMVALVAARERADLDIRVRGMAGRDDLPRLAVYTSQQAHSSVEKGAITAGIGQEGVRAIPTDAAFRMDVDALRHAIEDDIAAGWLPIAVVATVGTTSTTSIDPVPAIADVIAGIARDHGVRPWLHVDGAYGGMTAILPEMRHVVDGVERADSFVTNPHKWLFTPIDCTAFFVRDDAILRQAFSLVPEYLTTTDGEVTNYMDWGVQLGRRFRALKLWMVIRYFGRDGLEARIREHLDQAREVADWVAAHADFELMAPVPMSTVCFRANPGGGQPGGPGGGQGGAERSDEDTLADLNARLMASINATGELYLSHTVIGGHYVLRLATGSLRTTRERLRATLAVIDRELTACLEP